MLVGEATEWLSQFRALEERLAEAIESTWPICIAPLTAFKGTMTHEDHITNQLVAALIKSKKVPGRIIPQYSLLTETDDARALLSSNIDFVLTIGSDEMVYLACECKRLNVPYKSGTRGLVGEYVKDGLMRFVSGQYSDGLPLAMMLGYVMDARLAAARRGLRRAMTARAKAVDLRSTLEGATSQEGRQLRFTTRHGCHSGAEIEVSHTLLGWP